MLGFPIPQSPFNNVLTYAVTTQAEPDMRFVSLSFDLLRASPKPVNVQATVSRLGIFNEPVPEMKGTYKLIKFTELQEKLNQGLEVSLK